MDQNSLSADARQQVVLCRYCIQCRTVAKFSHTLVEHITLLMRYFSGVFWIWSKIAYSYSVFFCLHVVHLNIYFLFFRRFPRGTIIVVSTITFDFIEIFFVKFKYVMAYGDRGVFYSRVCVYVCTAFDAKSEFVTDSGIYFCVITEDCDSAGT